MPRILSSHPCAFCKGEFSILGDGPTTEPAGIAHSAPACAHFIEHEPDVYVRDVNTWTMVSGSLNPPRLN